MTTQQEVHDPINTIKRINEFSWTMPKLKILYSNYLDESSKRLTNFTKFVKEVTFAENGESKYQDVTLQNQQASLNALLKEDFLTYKTVLYLPISQLF